MKKQANLDLYFYITGWVVIALLVLAFSAGLFLQIPITQLIPPCTFHTVTGWYCPGCGGTRAMYFLVRGRLIKSFCYYPLVPFATIAGLWFMISQTIDRLRHGKFKAVMHMRMIYVYIAIGLVVLNWLVKNGLILFGGIYCMG